MKRFSILVMAKETETKKIPAFTYNIVKFKKLTFTMCSELVNELSYVTRDNVKGHTFWESHLAVFTKIKTAYTL